MARAQGSGSAVWKVVVGVLVSLHCCSLLASSATFTVGGTQGWTIGPDYATWAAGQTFAPGDVLLFPYTKGAHNVVEVGKAGYDACSATNALATHTEGNTSVTLASAGAYYFVCSFPGHCTAGMLLAVTVGGGAIAPAPAPNATAPAPAPVAATTPPAPVPSPASVATPVPVPAPAFTPTPTPSSTPAPAPLAPAPASTSTPPSSPSASSPPAPSGTTPPSSAPSLSSSTFLAAVLLGLGGALLAL